MNQEISFSSVQLSDALRTTVERQSLCFIGFLRILQYFSSNMYKNRTEPTRFLSTTSAIDLSDSICLYRGGKNFY